MSQIDILTFLHEFALNFLHRQRKQDFLLVSCRTSMLCTSQVSREHICNTVIAYSHWIGTGTRGRAGNETATLRNNVSWSPSLFWTLLHNILKPVVSSPVLCPVSCPSRVLCEYTCSITNRMTISGERFVLNEQFLKWQTIKVWAVPVAVASNQLPIRWTGGCIKKISFHFQNIFTQFEQFNCFVNYIKLTKCKKCMQGEVP